MQPDSIHALDSLTIRRAALADLDFLVKADLLNEGYTPGEAEVVLNSAGQAEHRAKIGAFVDGADDAAWVARMAGIGQPVGMILARFRNRLHELPTEANLFIFRYLGTELFPEDGRFCEVFNLWVHPSHRRRGLATCLKFEIEAEAKRGEIRMIYTHTEAANRHVIDLNLKLGYQIVRTGPLWDEVPRTSLVKWLK
jgi:ribosomal protein S18 acetylase RimI-like enzyme